MAKKIFFGSLAADYIAESGREIQEVAASIPKTPANQFSKWKTGKWTYIAERKLVQVIEAVTRDRQKRINLMIAYLVDMTPEEFRPWLDIVPKLGGEAPTEDLSGKHWSPSLRAKLEAIGDAYGRDENFMRMAEQLAKWAGKVNEPFS